VLLRNEMSDAQLIDYINRAKQGAPGVPVGYVDAYFLFVNHPAVSDACDMIFANCYPFWEGYPAEHALVYMQEMYRQATNAAKGKPVIISETGWPNAGTPDRGAVPSFENAVRYFINAYQWADKEDIDIIYFSAFDEVWKTSKEGRCRRILGFMGQGREPEVWVTSQANRSWKNGFVKSGNAICYSGYREGQDPRRELFPSYDQIREDLLILAPHWSFIRLYDSSRHAETTLQVIADEGLEMKVMLGVDMAAEVSNPNCPVGGDYSDETLAPIAKPTGITSSS
jgi:exo-beta-1,3-glucanase (GH17 family)